MQDVKIKVYDKQIYETHHDANETPFDGQITFKGKSTYVSYKDPKTGIATFIKVHEGVVSVKRMGPFQGNLEFNQDKPHRTIYFTPYGEMEIQITTKSCDIETYPKGIKISIAYEIMMQGKKISDNIYIIEAN